jgi:hypothetical protein
VVRPVRDGGALPECENRDGHCSASEYTVVVTESRGGRKGGGDISFGSLRCVGCLAFTLASPLHTPLCTFSPSPPLTKPPRRPLPSSLRLSPPSARARFTPHPSPLTPH